MSDTLEMLDAFSAAWGDGDLEKVLAFVDDDAVYLGSFGDDLDGTAFVGKAAIREGVAQYMAKFPGGRYERTAAIIDGDRAAIAWTFTWPTSDGEESVRGCDFFLVRDGRILRKDAFRKERRAW
ncbi:nuclear transport factor 2 family protein [Pseudonocardia sp. TRM90224]|uniref:nuclear transport factor 2 family protein n=1 Tax=Pseudonocardia sp. TRM90224 TaxID=2812678 RepID=UPI001E586011|nr:nuclear transport factor 2 family protein [Pseudonocardia sp. TRM90224]